MLDPDDLLMSCYWSGSSRHNWGGTAPAEIADLDALFLRQRTELDLDTRTATIHEIQRKMAEIMFVVPVLNSSGLEYHQPYVNNLNWRSTYAYSTDSFPWAYFNDERLAKG